MREILLKTYNNVAIFLRTEEGEAKIYSVENDNGAFAFTDLCDAVDCFNHLKEISKMKLKEDSKNTLVSDDEEPCFIYTESED